MTNLKKIAVLGSMILAIGATSITAFAASDYTTPANAVAGLSGRTVESVIAEKIDSEKTYGKIAIEENVSVEFRNEMINMKKNVLAEKVKAGTITQAEADEVLKALDEKQLDCDGTGSGEVGKNLGAGFGSKDGNGQGQSKALGNGQRNGQGGARRGQNN